MKKVRNVIIYSLCTLLSSAVSYYIIHDMKKVDGTTTTIGESICVSIGCGTIGFCLTALFLSKKLNKGGAIGMGDFTGGAGMM